MKLATECTEVCTCIFGGDAPSAPVQRDPTCPIHSELSWWTYVCELASASVRDWATVRRWAHVWLGAGIFWALVGHLVWQAARQAMR